MILGKKLVTGMAKLPDRFRYLIPDDTEAKIYLSLPSGLRKSRTRTSDQFG